MLALPVTMHYTLLLLCVCWCAGTLAVPAPYYAIEEASLHFEAFIGKFAKQYADEEEKAFRFKIFKANLEIINHSNNASSHAVFGITQFSDLTKEEFTAMYTGIRPELRGSFLPCDTVVDDSQIPDGDAPDSFDWRSRNVVTPVKDQLKCGSCYAFSTMAQIESQYAIRYGQILDLSEQQIVDCGQYSDGCNGGFMSSAMRELMRMGGAMSEADYPYRNAQMSCAADPNRVVVRLSSCTSYNLLSQEKLKQLLYHFGPIAVVIRSAGLQTYNGGILMDTSCIGGLDHAVLLVGYGTENGIPYWILKNSWGLSFGENGFFRLQRSEDPSGACAMMNNWMATGVV